MRKSGGLNDFVAILDALKSNYRYFPETGQWQRLKAFGRWKSLEPFYPNPVQHGYCCITFDGRRIVAHRLAWLYVHGEWPKGEIDHINGDKADNRICNLRDVGRRMNAENLRKARADCVSGLIGASLVKTGKYDARIRVNGTRIFLGSHKTAEEAHAVYVEAKRKMHEGCSI